MEWLNRFLIFVLIGICDAQVPHHFEEVKKAIETQECMQTMTPEMKRLIRYTLQQNMAKIEELSTRLKELEAFLKGKWFFNCPDGWVFKDTRCYWLSTKPETWDTAKETCKAAGGYLVEVNSMDENAFLGNYTGSVRGHSHFWLGATDRTSPGRWVWDNSGRDLTQGFTNWYPGEPNTSV